MEPVLDSLASQIYSSQSLEDIQYAGDRKYTSQVLLSAITDAVKKRRTLKLSAFCDPTFRFLSSPAHPARSLHLHHLASLNLLSGKVPHYLPSGHPEGRNV